MGTQTEAELLHQSGAAYRRRVGLLHSSGEGPLIFAGIRPGGFSLYLGESPHYHFDLEGRWERICRDGTHFFKWLDGSSTALKLEHEEKVPVLRRHSVPYAETSDLDEAARLEALSLLEMLGCGLVNLVAPPSPAEPLSKAELIELLDRISGWDSAAWFRNRERYLKVYGPRTDWFLPPSCPQPVVLSATRSSAPVGSWLFSTDSEVLVQSPQGFQAHCSAVNSLLGRRAAQARGIVLADGESLRRETNVILNWLETAAQIFPIEALGATRKLSERPVDTPALNGFYGFLNSPGGTLPDAEGWQRLRAAHLRRVDIGVVSGDEAIRHVHGHVWSGSDIERLVNDLKRAGISVGILVPVCAGGSRSLERHLELTGALLNSLPLSQGDQVYLVDPRQVLGENLVETLNSRGMAPWSSANVEATRKRFRVELEPTKAKKAQVVPYSLEKQ